MPGEKPAYAEELDRLDKEFLNYLLSRQNDFPEGRIVHFSPVGLMPNSANHEREVAITLLNEDIQRAKEYGLPDDLILYSVNYALRYRSIIFGVEEISLNDLQGL